MRAMLYDLLTTDPALQTKLGVDYNTLKTRVMSRRSQDDAVIPKPFIIYGLGNETNEQLSDSTANDALASRQFFQIWIHDEGGSFTLIDDIVEIIKRRLTGVQNVGAKVITVIFLETSQEFNNETYGTNFRYIRFQAVKAKAGTPS